MEDAKKLVNAHFFNNERNQVRVYYINEDDQEVEYVIPADPDHSLFQQLLETFTMDDIHENTWAYIKDQQTAFEQSIMTIAKREGQIYDVGTPNPKLYKEVARIVSQPFDPEKDKELLFVMKLEIFDLEEVKSCKERTLKSELRKAETPIDVLIATCNIIKHGQSD